MSTHLLPANPTPAALEIGVLRATELARVGDYAGAESILDELPGASAALDLRARIHAQRGRLTEAAAAWQAVCDQRPGDVGAEAALGRIRALQRGGYAAPGLGRVALFGLGLGLGLALAWWTARSSVPVASLHPPAALADTQKIAQAVTETLAPLLKAKAATEGSERAVPHVAPALDELQRVLAGDAALDVSAEADELVVRFREPLFQREDVFQPQAGAKLTRVAAALAPYADRVRVTIVGQTDQTPVTRSSNFPSNVAVGMARAVAVFRHFGEHDGLLPGLFALRSPGVTDGIKGASRPGDAQQRTATLRIVAPAAR